MRRADGVHSPVIQLPVRDERSDADDRVIDVLRKLVSDRLADLHVGLADQILRGREPAEIGHGLQVDPDQLLCGRGTRSNTEWDTVRFLKVEECHECHGG